MFPVNKDLTIVLVIKDRPQFTFRWMAYANSIHFPFKVLVADGGKDLSVTDKLLNSGDYPNLDYEYIRYPYDETYTEFYVKVADALSRVETEFVALGDDDDFFIVQGLLSSIEFLKWNPEYSACRGRVAPMRIIPDENSAYGNDVRFYMCSNVPSIESLIATERVSNHFSPYDITHYDVHRTEDITEFYIKLRDLDLKDIILAELLTSCLAVARGKVKRESYLYMLRQYNPKNSSNMEEIRKKGDLFDRMLLETWSGDFNGFVDAVAIEVAKNDGLELDEAKVAVKDSYRKHVASSIISCLSGEMKLQRLSKIPFFGTLVGNSLEKGRALRTVISSVLHVFRNNNQGAMDCNIKFYEEAQLIREFITKKKGR